MHMTSDYVENPVHPEQATLDYSLKIRDEPVLPGSEITWNEVPHFDKYFNGSDSSLFLEQPRRSLDHLRVQRVLAIRGN